MVTFVPSRLLLEALFRASLLDLVESAHVLLFKHWLEFENLALETFEAMSEFVDKIGLGSARKNGGIHRLFLDHLVEQYKRILAFRKHGVRSPDKLLVDSVSGEVQPLLELSSPRNTVLFLLPNVLNR